MRENQKAISTGSKADRIPALDFTKGALVLIMVLYHWINYFYGPHDNRYLRFLTPSFIFITGFIISNVYMKKYDISDRHLPWRLLERGLKLLGVFIVLNVTRSLLVRGSFQEQLSSAASPFNSLIDVYVMGSGVGGGQAKAVAFFILVPISYLLILSPLLIVLSRFYRYAFHAACLLCLLGIVLLDAQGLQGPNLELLSIGLMGVIIGYAPIEKVNALVRHAYWLTFAYILYLAAITLWNVTYSLQVAGVYLSLMVIYLLGQQSGKPGKTRACIVLLGKYSLFGYIAQIAILQLLHLGLHHIGSLILIRGLSFVLAFALTIISVELLSRLRAGSAVVDTFYKAIFA